MTNHALIECRGLTKRYGTFEAVSDLDLQVSAGEILGLIGANGAGKTSTLRCLAGILPPSSGVIHIAGHAMTGDALEAKRNLCFVPDTPHLFDYLTVEEHLRFAGRIYALADIDQRIARLLARFELESKARALPNSLSRGMRQKVAICLGFLHDPRAILLDEPLTGLDPMGIVSMKEAIIERAREHQAAVILSSHQLDVLQTLCDRVMIVDKGRIVMTGTIDELRRRFGAQQRELSLEELFIQINQPDRAARVAAEAHEG
jgi:ABC-2 type transport system ATP-binding protein